ncbi:hypothetical protein [Enterobacter sp. 186315]
MLAKKNAKESITNTIFFFFICIMIFFFFRYIHPVTAASGDDWINLPFYREAIPEWAGFNPSKVVPELTLPLIGQISAFVIMPFGYDFLTAISITTAIFISLLTCIFLIQFFLLMKNKIGADNTVSLIITFICFLFLFGAFKTLNDNRSPYLLWEAGLTCYFHYLTPALINGSMVLYLMRNDLTYANLSLLHPTKVGGIVLAIYLCIFSNIFSSVFLAVYCGVSLIPPLINSLKYRNMSFLQHPIHIFAILLFIISAIFEMNGGRAGRIGKDHLRIPESLSSLFSLLATMNYLFATLIVVMTLIGCIYSIFYIKSRMYNSFTTIFWVSLLSLFISTISLILICSKAGAGYASRPVAMYGIFLFMMIACFSSIAEISKQNKIIHYILPMLVLFLLNVVVTKKTSLREPHDMNMKFSEAYTISNNIIQTVIDADINNQTSVEVRVPKIGQGDNWPFPLTRGRAIGDTLRSNGLIKNYFEIKIIPDENINKKLNLKSK